ncbi:MAG: hypothetical protein P8Z35_24575, partial [Ignavibacteriaceae bacterium]
HFRALPEWAEKLIIGDWSLHILNAQLGKIKYIPEVMSVYREHSNSIWSSKGWHFQLKGMIDLYNAVNLYLGYRYDSLISKIVDKHIDWRFNQALIEMGKNNYDVSHNYFKRLSEIFPNLTELKLGYLFLEIILDKKVTDLNPVINYNQVPDKLNSSLNSRDLNFRYYPLSNNRLDTIKSNIYKEVFEKGVEKRNQNKYSLIDHFDSLKKIDQNPMMPEIWNINDDDCISALYAHAPSKIYYKVPIGNKGNLEFGVCIYKDCWNKPEAAGGCVFNLVADQRSVFSLMLDPVNRKDDRGIFYFSFDIPADKQGFHELLFETKTIGDNNNFRWSLWINPVFYYQN